MTLIAALGHDDVLATAVLVKGASSSGGKTGTSSGSGTRGSHGATGGGSGGAGHTSGLVIAAVVLAGILILAVTVWRRRSGR